MTDDLIQKACPRCSCPHFEQTAERTSDNHRAWQDTDGTWYNGPAREKITRRCSSCGWSQVIRRARGKHVATESEPT